MSDTEKRTNVTHMKSGEKPRVEVLATAIEPMLEDGEYCLILSKDMGSFIIMPRDLKNRLQEGGQPTPVDTLPPVALAVSLLSIVARDHIQTVAQSADPDGVSSIVGLPGILGPDGKPINQ